MISRILSGTLSSEHFHVHSMAHPFGAAALVHPSGTLQAKGIGVGQSKLMVGGVVVQAQGCVAGDGMTAYVAGSVPHSHQPGPSAISGTGIVRVGGVVVRDGRCACRGMWKGSRKVLRGSLCSAGNGGWRTG